MPIRRTDPHPFRIGCDVDNVDNRAQSRDYTDATQIVITTCSAAGFNRCGAPTSSAIRLNSDSRTGTCRLAKPAGHSAVCDYRVEHFDLEVNLERYDPLLRHGRCRRRCRYDSTRQLCLLAASSIARQLSWLACAATSVVRQGCSRLYRCGRPSIAAVLAAEFRVGSGAWLAQRKAIRQGLNAGAERELSSIGLIAVLLLTRRLGHNRFPALPAEDRPQSYFSLRRSV